MSLWAWSLGPWSSASGIVWGGCESVWRWGLVAWSGPWDLIVPPHKLWFIHAVKLLILIAFYYSWSSFFYLQGVDCRVFRRLPWFMPPPQSLCVSLQPTSQTRSATPGEQCNNGSSFPLQLELLCLTSIREWPLDTFPGPGVGFKSSSHFYSVTSCPAPTKLRIEDLRGTAWYADPKTPVWPQICPVMDVVATHLKSLFWFFILWLFGFFFVLSLPVHQLIC